MLDEQQRADGVGFERGEGVGAGDLGGGFLRVEDARDAEGEVEVGRWEAGGAVARCGGDGGFICQFSFLQYCLFGGRWCVYGAETGRCLPVTSSSRTWRRSWSTSRPSRIRALVSSRSFRAVATTGRSVVRSRRLASWRPMPREAGVVRIHGFGAIFKPLGTTD